MRVALLSALLAAGIAQQTLATPLRIIVVDPISNTNANIRLGHALANANVNGNDDSLARIDPATAVATASTNPTHPAHHFCAKSLRDKALSISNSFRHALGLPLIEIPVHKHGHHHASHAAHEGANAEMMSVDNESNNSVQGPSFHILPLPVLGSQVAPDASVDAASDVETSEGEGRIIRIYRHHRFADQRASFLRRVHRALMALGPWEGRAVAFVLGCGLGVLLRMLWVMAVLSYRMIKGEKEDDSIETEYIVFEQDAESIYAPPPQYTDEKVEVLAPSTEEKQAKVNEEISA